MPFSPKARELAAAYHQGPFPGAHVPPWPDELIELVGQLTGQRFDPRLFTAYERVRAFAGYQGVALTPDRQLAQEPVAAGRAPVARPSPAARPAGPLTAPDPTDLGDG